MPEYLNSLRIKKRSLQADAHSAVCLPPSFDVGISFLNGAQQNNVAAGLARGGGARGTWRCPSVLGWIQLVPGEESRPWSLFWCATIRVSVYTSTFLSLLHASLLVLRLTWQWPTTWEENSLTSLALQPLTGSML